MQALQIYAGPLARQAIAKDGLQPDSVRTIAAAAGGPKGLVLGALDRFIFGDWLAQSTQAVDLVGASIGAWRMATACLNDPVHALNRLEHDYLHQHYAVPAGRKRPFAADVSAVFGRNLQAFYAGRVGEVLHHPRYRLHIITARGRHLLQTEHRLRTPIGYLGAFLTNAVHRKAMGAWLERVVFSSPQAPCVDGACAALPFGTGDYRTRQVALNDRNFNSALQASCSIPFALKAVHDIPGAPPGAYWDGGITDYHLHLNYPKAGEGLVLYPHFQKAVVPGWLDKNLKWRHKASRFLDNVVLLAPHPQWVKALPNGKLPDRTDFTHHGNDFTARAKVWQAACSASLQLADEFAAWLRRPSSAQVLDL